ncbi:hypothetical protein GO986_12310 [Deinococcus sp. HMF7620]|uniref:Uncharacterized protein n=1 Tax=Deinococcus arboris TaxID=2682977 RepID=A0A7C9HS63_9DEIO|nr:MULTISPECIES: hypothetical protein [Deinococcus]MBZ9752197.1 hypothetical protein [Deinococcus betulae]MVN87549.1 hypothetical protein [Deinococcus arboris]
MEYDRIYRFDQEPEWRFGITWPKLGKSAGVGTVVFLLIGGVVQGIPLLAILLGVVVATYLAIATYERAVPKRYIQNLYYYMTTPMVFSVTNDSHPLPLAVPRHLASPQRPKALHPAQP